MVQIAFIVLGIVILVKGELKFSRRRGLSAVVARTCGAIILLGALLPFVVPELGMGAIGIAVVVAFILGAAASQPIPDESERRED